MDLTLPKLGPEMESAVLVEWLVAEGDQVAAGQSVASVETAKVTAEIPAPVDGVISGLVAVDGEYAVGERMAVIGGDGDTPGAVAAVEVVAVAPNEPISREQSEREEPPRPTSIPGRIAASPLVRVMARERGVDLEQLSRRIGGRPVRRADLEGHSDEPSTGGRRVELSPMRRAIAVHMSESLAATAQITDVREHEVSALIAFREAALAWTAPLGFRVGYTDLLVRATALALREVPELNSSPDGDRAMVLHDEVNLGIAVALPDGLVVPVLHGADRLGLREVHEAIADLVADARGKRLTERQMSGGTFTLTNIGSYGSQIATPILVSGQVGILGTGAFTPRPVVRDGAVVAGTVLHTSLTIDHRLVDGATAGAFQTAVGRLIAEPERLV